MQQSFERLHTQLLSKIARCASEGEDHRVIELAKYLEELTIWHIKYKDVELTFEDIRARLVEALRPESVRRIEHSPTPAPDPENHLPPLESDEGEEFRF